MSRDDPRLVRPPTREPPYAAAASRLVTAAVVAGLALGALAAPASAQSRQWSDPRGDVGDRHPNITAVRLSNTDNRAFVRIDLRELSDRTVRGAAGATVWLDTAGGNYPEFVISSGISRDTDYSISRANGWRASSQGPLPCDLAATVDYAGDVLTFATGRDCLGRYGRLRVSVEVSSGGRTDYSPGRHRWHPYVARG